MFEVGPNLFHASGLRPDAIGADLVAIALVRDEMWRLPFFLAYHRWLGVQHFIIIDNRSKDGTPDYLGDEPDVTCILAPGEYGGQPKGQNTWLRWALAQAPPERWNLLLDADELFVGTALRKNDLLRSISGLDDEGVAIATASLVDCYSASFPPPKSLEPVPWLRAPYFDRGPYFQWPESGPRIRNLYHGVRQRICWPNWHLVRQVRKIVPRPIRPRQMYNSPPAVVKMPLLRNVPGLALGSVHNAVGAPRSKTLFSLLHYKLDIDLMWKVQSALRERQYWQNSREYESYARLIARGNTYLRCNRSCIFDGVQSLIDAEVASPGKRNKVESEGEISLPQVVDEVWRQGDLTLQKQVWNHQQFDESSFFDESPNAWRRFGG